MSKANRNLEELSPLTQQKLKLVLAEVGDIIFVTEGYRSQARQNELYAQGRTAPGNIVTHTLHSNHTSRQAVDIAFRWPTLYPSASDKRWVEVANVFKKYWFNWWGDRIKRKDRPHFEDNWKPLDNTIIMNFYEKLRTDNYSTTEKDNRMFKDPAAFINRIKDLPLEEKLSEMTYLIAILAEKKAK